MSTSRTKSTPTELYDAIQREQRRAGVRVLDLSFNELADMYETGELEIKPEYQRSFRWSIEKCSRFIESVALEMPVPPIYAIEVSQGRWQLIDGLQRLSTYLYLRGVLEVASEVEEFRIQKGDLLKLQGCDIVPELNGFVFDELPTSIKYRIRRATLRVEVVREESNPRFAYYMFKRLNTGGEQLSEQEIRNCSIRLLGTRFLDFINALSRNSAFQACIEDITDEYRQRMGAQELVLRFLAFKNNLQEYKHNIHDFMTDYIERATDIDSKEHIDFDYQHEERRFSQTFQLLAQTLGKQAFCRVSNGNYTGGFSMGHFEAFSLGAASVIDGVPTTLTPDLQGRISEALRAIKQDDWLKKYTVGGGKNFKNIYERKIALVANAIRSAT